MAVGEQPLEEGAASTLGAPRHSGQEQWRLFPQTRKLLRARLGTSRLPWVNGQSAGCDGVIGTRHSDAAGGTRGRDTAPSPESVSWESYNRYHKMEDIYFSKRRRKKQNDTRTLM